MKRLNDLPRIVSMLTSFIEHPGKISLVIYLPGCNWRCIYCHNYEVVLDLLGEGVGMDEFRWELENNKLIELVVVTGGEPTIHGGKLLNLVKFIRDVRPDLKIRIDTNGSNPEALSRVESLIDGIALDIKAPPDDVEKYSVITGVRFDREKFMKSVVIARDLPLTIYRTVRYPCLTDEDLNKIRRFVEENCGGKPHYITEFNLVKMPENWRKDIPS
ncbi:MAG: glycyl radical-activating protein [Thaumarchaeota archaeon]|nr:MAG: glycyl radical-activating protein [Nitrososphaerota archaeon]